MKLFFTFTFLLYFYTLNNHQQSELKYLGNGMFLSLRHGAQRVQLPPKKTVLHFMVCHPHIITLLTQLLAAPGPINMANIIRSFLLRHLTLDASKNTFQSVPSPEFLPITRQILKSSVIKVLKYKVQDTTEVIKKESRLQ